MLILTSHFFGSMKNKKAKMAVDVISTLTAELFNWNFYKLEVKSH